MGGPHKTAKASYTLGDARGVADALKVALARKAICAEAVRLVKAGELYENTPTAEATEQSAMMEAGEIVRQIDNLLSPGSRSAFSHPTEDTRP